MMNREEIENLMDEFNVKPMTKGLGFHHSLAEKKDMKKNLEHQKNSLLTDLETRAERIYKNQSFESKEPIHMGELSAFYENNEPRQIKDLPELIDRNEIKVTQEANLAQRFMAWVIDLGVIVSMVLTSVLVILLFSELTISSLSNSLVMDDLAISFSGMFVLFYLFYFSFLDKTKYSTLGKRLFNIKVEPGLARLDYVASFARASLSVFSVLTLGLFTLLSLHDTFTGTKVIKLND